MQKSSVNEPNPLRTGRNTGTLSARCLRRLVASLYQWLYRTAWKVFYAFGFGEAKNLYRWRKDPYVRARADGEDVDLEGEVEFADPAKMVRYIRASEKLKLRRKEIDQAISSIANVKLRHAFEDAHRMFVP